MYYPKFDGPLFLNDDMGTYAPRVHQRILSKLDSGLRWLFEKEKKINLEPLPETMVNEDETSPTPDLVLVDPDTELIRVVIEICHTVGLKGDIRKVVNLLDNNLYDIQEGFIYDYKTGKWYRYKANTGGLVEESSWSDVLVLDLNAFLLP
ncbi:hypothetical protein [Fibrella forsythiae]|uniref:Uma2 family endonuclease n=1 Tax=Fibrella forsythiae TaxID=2817061 RepID=A0ABS3JDW3_9BACT|nr:hypothetical protein [Fibrella forsythiae]MBO0948201.1 hypothetical protein [Fibrella forsythiae]